MRRSVVGPGLALLVLTLSVAPVRAKIPEPSLCELPTRLWLVGRDVAGQPDSVLGRVHLTLRDPSNNPVEYVPVVFDFTRCPDCELQTSTPGDPVQVDCSARRVQGETNLVGELALTIVGSARGPGTPGPAEVDMYGDGVYLGRIRVAIPDLDGKGGLGANDISLLIGDWASGVYLGRSDMDASGALGINDLSVWLGIFGAGTSVVSAGPVCP